MLKVRAMAPTLVCHQMSLIRPGKQGLSDVLLPQQIMHWLKPASSVVKPTYLVCLWYDTLSLLSAFPSFPLFLSASLSNPVLFCPFQRASFILIQLGGRSHISLDKLSDPQRQQLKVLLVFFNHSLVLPLDNPFCLLFCLFPHLFSWFCFSVLLVDLPYLRVK